VHEVKNHTILEENVIKTLLYYDIFQYPLKGSEVFCFLRINSVTEKDVIQCLDGLVQQKCVSKFGELYSLQPTETNIERRIKGNQEAKRYLPLAKQRALQISRFPFVRAVLASGSLSKDYMDENSDLDFFIVTAPSRLWISRTLLVIYKRLFLHNSHKQFCVNYFVDSEHLEIEEKNLFTATELATVIPLYGADYYHQLIAKNKSWLTEYFPNFKPRDAVAVPVHQKVFLKKVTEGVINLLVGKSLNLFFMWLTQRRWKQLYASHYNVNDFKIAFKTKEYVSKNHPRHFQKKVMDHYREQLLLINKTLNSKV
jgi:hypothetical protein